MRLAVIDLEMTGLSPESARIVEIAVVQTDGLVEVSRWSSLVRAEVLVGDSERIHHISDAMLADAPTLASLRDEIAAQLAGRTIVAHRAAFDLSFLHAAARRGEIAEVGNAVIDTASVAARALGETGLAAIARKIGGRAPSHRALPDALAALDAIAACVETLGGASEEELVALSSAKPSMRSGVRTLLEVGANVGIVYRPASGRAHEDVIRVESVAPPYVTGVLETKGVRRVLRGDRIVRAWTGTRPVMRFF